jgi:hypothetical protein
MWQEHGLSSATFSINNRALIAKAVVPDKSSTVILLGPVQNQTCERTNDIRQPLVFARNDETSRLHRLSVWPRNAGTTALDCIVLVIGKEYLLMRHTRHQQQAFA